MPATYEPISTNTLSSTASSITFSSIPATYTDLKIIFMGTTTTGNRDLLLRFNSDTSTNYSQSIIYADGSSVSNAREINASSINLTYFGVGVTTNVHSYFADILSYAGSKYKTVLAVNNEDDNGSGRTVLRCGLWRSTSAINSITLSLSAGSMSIGTTASLYGIKAA